MITLDFFSTLFPFMGMSTDKIEEIYGAARFSEKSFKRGDTVFGEGLGECIGFVTEGECEVRQIRHDGSSVTLNRLGRCDSFGILSVFGKEEFPTEIHALRSTSVTFFSREDFISLLYAYPEISLNVIAFLAGKVSFLNKRIKTFSGTRVEDRLASFLLGEAEKYGEALPFNCKKTAEAINSGRASVYRALASLESLGLIKFDTKTVTVLNLEGLKNF